MPRHQNVWVGKRRVPTNYTNLHG